MINEIRNAFSKGSIVVSQRGIEVFYTYKGQWFSQSIDNPRIFGNLLDSSDGFVIDYRAGRFIRFVFENVDDSRQVVFYSPLVSEVSVEELQEILEREGNVSDEFIEFFMGTDLDDEESIAERFLDWIKRYDEEIDESIVNLSDVRKREAMRGFCDKLAGFLSCGIDYTPDCFELFLPQKTRGFCRVSNDMKDVLRNLLFTCSMVSIEGDVDTGILNIGFFV